MTATNLFLAIDQGGHSSRALVFDGGGRLIAQGQESIAVTHPQEGWVEHAPQEVLLSTRHAIDQAVAALGERHVHIVAAGLATQRSSIVCWDRDSGAALSPVISWQDRRAAPWVEQFYKHDPAIHHATGLFMTAHYGVSKLHWCMEHLPAVKAAFQQERLAWGPMASFMLFNLLEEKPMWVDPANASRTLLWNLHTLDWDEELLDLFGVPHAPLPRCVPTCYEFGHLNLRGRGVPLTVMTGDQSAALYAFGAPHHATAYVNIGTGAFVQRVCGGNIDYAPRLLTSVVLQCGDAIEHVLEGTINGAGSALLEVEGQLGVSIHEAESGMAHWLETVNAVPLFLNGVSGLGSPYWLPRFASQFIGTGTAAEKLVAVVESIVFLTQVNLNEMESLFVSPQRIVASGGLAHLDGICQRLADLSGRPVYRPAEVEATARGTAFLLAGRPAQWAEPEPGSLFQPQINAALQLRFEQWQAAMRRAIARS